MYNEWPSSDVKSPVYVVVLENVWGWRGKKDQLGYQVWFLGRLQGEFTTYEAADELAQQLYDRSEWGH